MNMVEAHWVDVTWMPHSSLSQTSYVALAIRELSIPEECRVQVEVQGLGGLHWTVPCQTTATDGVWNQILLLPIRWRDLPRDVTLSFDLISAGDIVVHNTSLRLFDTFGRLKTGLQRLMLDGCEADRDDQVWNAYHTLNQLEHLAPNPTFGRKQAVPWLDEITRQHCHKVLARSKDEESKSMLLPPQRYLMVELPTFDVPILHEETLYQTQSTKAPFYDFEREHDNPVEDKYRTLAHDLLRGLVDPALKPDREQRDLLAAIISSPSHHPTTQEKDLLWRFRFSLVDNRRALTKFLLAVDWTVESEVVQAAELLEQWRQRSPIEVTDALKLLGKHVAFSTSLVRSYAIDTLAAAPDEELRLYLLQLVQAIKYENMNTETNQVDASSSLAQFLIDRAANNIQLATYLYWYLKVEMLDPAYGPMYQEVFESLKARLSDIEEPPEMVESAKGFMKLVASTIAGASRRETDSTDKSKGRSAWDVLVTQDIFITGIMDLQKASRHVRGKKDAKEQHFREALAKNGFDRKLVGNAVPIPCAPRIMVDGVYSQSTKMFKSALYPALVEFRVDRVLSSPHSKKKPKQQSLSSSISASKKVEPLTSYKLMVKTGDDLRQDQLVMMMIQLLDGLLKRETLDLCLTPYSIIAMSTSCGLMEFVDGSIPISQILAKHNNSILNFFQSTSPQSGAKYEIKPGVLSTYIRSCAGYCVITYLLGVGDRHLDNILLQASGHFFHIDFGFIFGRDPKPLPPAFRLTREVWLYVIVRVRVLSVFSLTIFPFILDG